MILGIIILILICGALPFLLGFLPVGFMRKEHQNLTMVWVCGWLIMLAVAEVVIVPFVVLEQSFTLTAYVFSGVLALVSILGMIFSYKYVKSEIKNLMSIKTVDVLQIFVLLLIVGQLVASIFMQYLDGDDSFYVAASLTTLHTDQMYIYNPYMGAHGILDLRHALSPVPVFLSWLSFVSGIHVTIMCHSMISVFLIALRYCVIYLLANELFGEQKKNKWLFMLFVNVWYLFGNVSLFAAESFAYTRTWQGKSIFPNVVIPTMFVFLLMIAKDTMYPGEWCMIFILTLAGICTTSTAIFLMPILMGIAVAFLCIIKKKPIVLAQSLACLLPGAFFGLLYLFLK